ncbi:MAG: hypothetical protein HY901_07800 [Deltaproteobacteria bacterium]|nr:hypothetical protein [Deltaproteobacteria bacterium]
MTLKYDRALGEKFLGLIAGHEVLRRFLAAPGVLSVNHHPRVTLDTQLRRGNIVSIYAGLTKVLELKYLSDDRLEAKADASYMDQEPATRLGVYGTFRASEIEAKVLKWDVFLGAIKVKERQWHKEGGWQSWLARLATLGQPLPWIAVDREAELEELTGDDKVWLKEVQQRISSEATEDPALRRRKRRLEKARGGGVDFIGVTPDGDLALMEAKHGSDEQGVYGTPIQVGGYAALWTRALQAPGERANLVRNINRLIDQKRGLGLIPAQTPDLKDEPRVEPFVFIGDPKFTSQVWRGQRLLGRVLSAATKVCEPAQSLRFFTAESARFDLREVTAELREGRDVVAR